MIYVGLQNAEGKYAKNRHNVGAIVLEYLVNSFEGKFVLDKYTNCFKYNNFYLPNTFMNLSGESVGKIYNQEKKNDANFSSKNIFVLFDDVTIPVGQYKISVGEGASSHNGIKSIIENLGGKNDFVRVRIGVGKIIKVESAEGKIVEKIYEPGPEKLSDFVLSNLNNLEIAQIQSKAREILEKCESMV